MATPEANTNTNATTEPTYPTPVPGDEGDDGPQADTPVKSQSSQQNSQSQSQSQNDESNNKRPSLIEKAKMGISQIGSRFQRNSDKNDSRLSMNGLLKQARISFEKWVEVEKPYDYPTPNGIVFLTSIKGAVGWGGELSTGIVLYRIDKKSNQNQNQNNNRNNNNNSNDDEKQDSNKNENNNNNDNNDREYEWSGPCAIGSGGVSFGLQIGISKIDHIIMLPQKHHIRTFTSNGQLKLGGSSELTVVNVGLKAQGSVNISNKEISDIHSYSLDTKGLSIGVSVEGAVIQIRNDCNKSFYQQAVSAQDIADGNVSIPDDTVNEDYNKIIEILNQHFKIRRPIFHPPPPLHGVPPPGPHGIPPPPHHHAPDPALGAAAGAATAVAVGSLLRPGPGRFVGRGFPGRGGGPIAPLVGAAVLGTAAVVAASRQGQQPPPPDYASHQNNQQNNQNQNNGNDNRQGQGQAKGNGNGKVVSSNVNVESNVVSSNVAQNESGNVSNSQIEGKPSSNGDANDNNDTGNNYE